MSDRDEIHNITVEDLYPDELGLINSVSLNSYHTSESHSPGLSQRIRSLDYGTFLLTQSGEYIRTHVDIDMDLAYDEEYQFGDVPSTNRKPFYIWTRNNQKHGVSIMLVLLVSVILIGTAITVVRLFDRD